MVSATVLIGFCTCGVSLSREIEERLGYGAQNEAYKMMESRKVGKVVSLQRVMRGLMVEAPQNETFTLV